MKRRGTEGAVYVEFLIAFMPLFVFYMSLVQLAFVEIADLVVKHAAVIACRAAIVVLPDDPEYYDGVDVNSATGKRKETIERAAKAPLRAIDASPEIELRFPSSPDGDDSIDQFGRDDTVRVHLEYEYTCAIPLGRMLVCGAGDGKKRLEAEAAMPNQGAGYEY